MKILITGVCGFVGSTLARALVDQISGASISGVDNLSRPGSEMNRSTLRAKGIQVLHGDVRLWSDVERLPGCDWVIDAAATPSVLAGLTGASPRQLYEHNLLGTLNVLEYCRENKTGLVLLSTSRVYSIESLAALPVAICGNTFQLDASRALPEGVNGSGITEQFSTLPPISLYGATKLCSETMALEAGSAFGFPVWINRCGVLAGAGQFGTAEQGIFSYWLHAHAARKRLRYIGFGGRGYQVRDALHPVDLANLIAREFLRDPGPEPIYNAAGGVANSISLGELTAWCDQEFGRHQPIPDDQPRPYDIPWLILNNARVSSELGWTPQIPIGAILREIAEHVRANPDWLSQTL